jgi:pimeloyl-ACP methyl ester carboxylesterase
MLPDLARDHTVITWDAPGFGESSDIDDSWQAPQVADGLVAFVAALGLERPRLVGHSFGTMVALSLYRRHPASPASFVLVGGYWGEAGSLPVARWRDGSRCSSAWPSWARPSSQSPTRSVLRAFTGRPRRAVLGTMMRENIRPATVRAAGYIGPETDLRPVLPTVDVPTLVLHGEADARSPLA